jgi:hypothetical protein
MEHHYFVELISSAIGDFMYVACVQGFYLGLKAQFLDKSKKV